MAPSVIEHPQLGRLMIFDPTDEMTPPGYLPDYEQDSLALVLAGDSGALLRMPVTPPSANRVEREADVTLDAEGTISAKARERSYGERAANVRRSFVRYSRPDYLKRIEHWVASTATEATVSKVEPAPAKNGTEFNLGIEFSAPRLPRASVTNNDAKYHGNAEGGFAQRPHSVRALVFASRKDALAENLFTFTVAVSFWQR